MRLSRLLDPFRYRWILLRRHVRLARIEGSRRRAEAAFALLCAEAQEGGGIFRDCHSFLN